MAHLKKASSGHLLKTSGGHLVNECAATIKECPTSDYSGCANIYSISITGCGNNQCSDLPEAYCDGSNGNWPGACVSTDLEKDPDYDCEWNDRNDADRGYKMGCGGDCWHTDWGNTESDHWYIEHYTSPDGPENCFTVFEAPNYDGCPTTDDSEWVNISSECVDAVVSIN